MARDFWIRAVPQTQCSENDNVNNIKGILHYHTQIGIPETNATYFDDGCVDESLSNLVPIVPKSVSAADLRSMGNVTVAKNTENLSPWYLNSTSMQVAWEIPRYSKLRMMLRISRLRAVSSKLQMLMNGFTCSLIHRSFSHIRFTYTGMISLFWPWE